MHNTFKSLETEILWKYSSEKQDPLLKNLAINNVLAHTFEMHNPTENETVNKVCWTEYACCLQSYLGFDSRVDFYWCEK